MASLVEIIEALGTALSQIEGLRVYPTGSTKANPPSASVLLPEVIEYDSSMGRGIDRYLIPVRVLVSQANDRAELADLAPYMAGAGPQSVKEALEAEDDLGLEATAVRVLTATPGVWTVEGVDYLGSSFLTEIYA